MIVVAVTINNNFSENLSALLKSIAVSNTSAIAFYIISDFISEVNKERLRETIRTSNIQLSFILSPSLNEQNFKVDKHASLANYYRLFLPGLLPPSLKKVIYLDSDTIVLDKLDKLWETNIDEYALAGVLYTNEERINSLSLKHGKYVNSGVLLFNLDYWRKKGITEKLVNFIIRKPELLKFWDQDAINIVLEDEIKYLTQKWNFCGEYSKSKEIKILHFVGMHKPHSKHYPKGPNKKIYYRYLYGTPFWKFKYFQFII